MKPQKKFLNEITNKTGPHSVLVKVIEKSRAQTSPSKSVKYQKITFQDEKGNTMKATLFNDDIAAYDDVIVRKKKYEISYPHIKPLDPEYQTEDDKFQMVFNNRTIIQPLNAPDEKEEPKYHSVASIPRAASGDESFDLLGVVIYVEPLRSVPGRNGQTIDLREIVVTDSITNQPITVSAWNDFATNEAEQLANLVPSFPVIALTALRASSHKGFTLSTTISTFLETNPEGEKAELLRAWAKGNVMLITQRQSLVIRGRANSDQNDVITFNELKAKKAANTTQEETHWISVVISEMGNKDIRLYLGCDRCGTRSGRNKGETYNCLNCKRNSCFSVPRMSFTFEAVDDTSSHMFTAFTETLEKLLGKTAEQLYEMEHEDFLECIKIRAEKLTQEHFRIKVGPAATLSRSRALKWVLKDVVLP